MRGASVGAGVCAAIGLGLGLGVGLSVSEGSLPARAAEVGGVDIVGDDEADRFVGSGAVFLPSTVSVARRQQAAWCHGCRWRQRVIRRVSVSRWGKQQQPTCA